MSTEVTRAEDSSTVAFSAATSDEEAAVDMDGGTAEERMGLVDPRKVQAIVVMRGMAMLCMLSMTERGPQQGEKP